MLRKDFDGNVLSKIKKKIKKIKYKDYYLLLKLLLIIINHFFVISAKVYVIINFDILAKMKKTYKQLDYQMMQKTGSFFIDFYDLCDQKGRNPRKLIISFSLIFMFVGCIISYNSATFQFIIKNLLAII